MKSEVVFAGFGITPKIMEDIVKLYFVADIPLFFGMILMVGGITDT